MKQKEKVLYQFAFKGIHFRLSEIKEKIYLISSRFPNLSTTPLDLPKPGPYHTSTSSSTYDTRGDVIFEFARPKIKANEAVIDITITKTGEYWYYGSLDDDWHSMDPTVNKKRLTISRKLDRADYRLEDIL